MRPLLVLLLIVMVLPAQERETPVPRRDLGRGRAINRGLDYLAREQRRDGSWGEDNGVVGISSLALLAFMAGGHQENRGPHGDVIHKGIGYLLKRSLVRRTAGKPTGYIWTQGDADSRMHGHGYATQALVLAYGAAGLGKGRAAELKEKIQRAVRVIEESQTVTGGWGYEPQDSSFHEGSVTVTVCQALRLARDAGFVVDREVIERGLKYLYKSQKGDGSFKYRLTSDNSTEALTAAAITAMHGFGEYYGKPIRDGLEFLYTGYRRPSQIAWTFYSNYYAAQAFHRAGGRYWRRWETRVIPFILSHQAADGSWDDIEIGNTRAHHRKAFATAFAVLALAVPDGYLPTFQR
ncbi:MAG: prenyltransferase/squalene oxidase repeat-containing protein [Planctomycetota bacterium]